MKEQQRETRHVAAAAAECRGDGRVKELHTLDTCAEGIQKEREECEAHAVVSREKEEKW